ncbi:MAG: hypothetical protein Unbinned5930contig1000_33 [Prokaryotic dsDNA virus sp.]|nr:MAG: hypothetical protein Unbinned5930contig1000_33 [Prokaryotic dsDNA virus sp.]|tara:strand:+ start:377 stop:583 length:207 start_codon:yes stop_codon:yes gene_type:complete
MEGYGWLNTLYSIASDGVFTHGNMNAIDSVLKTNLYKVMTYQSYKSSVAEFEKEAQKEIDRKTPKKKR